MHMHIQHICINIHAHVHVKLYGFIQCPFSFFRGTRYGSWPKTSFDLRVLSLPAPVCLCVRPSVRQPWVVCAITCDPLKPESPNLGPRCHTHCLRELYGVFDLDLQVEFNLKVKMIEPRLVLCHCKLSAVWCCWSIKSPSIHFIG